MAGIVTVLSAAQSAKRAGYISVKGCSAEPAGSVISVMLVPAKAWSPIRNTFLLYDAEGNFVYLYPRDASAESYTVADGCRGIIGCQSPLVLREV